MADDKSVQSIDRAIDIIEAVAGELLRLIEVGASCFNHYCVGCGVTQLNVLHNVHRRISLG
ncbi:MAG: hypothetical protein PUG78_03535 [Eubacteriales bacterium]|nr:hypothetical protein [Eubacteriales bacterium]